MAKDPFADIVRQTQRGTSLKLHKPAPEADDEEAEGAGDPRFYKACRRANRPPRLDAIPATGPGHAAPYIGLVDVMIDERHPNICAVIFNFQIILLNGRNLWPLAEEIKRHRAEVIRCYNPNFYDLPEEGKPIIERMEFRHGETIENMVEMIRQAAG